MNQSINRSILHLITALKNLHSLGIVYRGLRGINLRFWENGHRFVVCDIESRWGNRLALAGWMIPLRRGGRIFMMSAIASRSLFTRMLLVQGRLSGLFLLLLIRWLKCALCDVPEDSPTLDELSEMVEAFKQ